MKSIVILIDTLLKLLFWLSYAFVLASMLHWLSV